MEAYEIYTAITLLIGILCGIFVGWYVVMYLSKKKYLDPFDRLQVTKKRPKTEQEDPEGKVDLKTIIKKREDSSYTSFSCETDGENTKEQILKNREGSNRSYEYLKKKNDEAD